MITCIFRYTPMTRLGLYKAGIISFKLSIIDPTTREVPINFKKELAWKKPVPKRMNVYKVRAYIFQCRDLPAADSDGQSDPYITFWDQSDKLQTTPVIEDNVNPMHYMSLEV